MEIDRYQYELLEKLSFNRYGGTDDEKMAAGIIFDAVKEAGGTPEIMEFEIPAYDVTLCKATCDGKELEVQPFCGSGEIKDGGEDYKIVYIEGNTDDHFRAYKDLSGYCAIIHMPDYDTYKRLAERNCSAFIAIAGKWYNSEADTDMMRRNLRKTLKTFGIIPGFVMRARDVLYLLSEKKETVHLELKQTETKHTSRDVLAVIEGTEKPEESIVLTAHYDSVLVGTGSWDNASGAVMLNRLFRHFMENKPKRTMRFVWCGSEEQGLLGAIAYIKQHMSLMDEIRFCFNFDMNGTYFGPNMAFMTGGDDLKNYFEQACKEYGYVSDSMMRVHSSDSAPFNMKGIPSLGLSRGGLKAMDFHTRYDVIDIMSAEEMYKNFLFASYLIGRFVNSAVLPIERKLNEETQKKVNEYFGLDKDKDRDIFAD